MMSWPEAHTRPRYSALKAHVWQDHAALLVVLTVPQQPCRLVPRGLAPHSTSSSPAPGSCCTTPACHRGWRRLSVLLGSPGLPCSSCSSCSCSWGTRRCRCRREGLQTQHSKVSRPSKIKATGQWQVSEAARAQGLVAHHRNQASPPWHSTSRASAHTRCPQITQRPMHRQALGSHMHRCPVVAQATAAVTAGTGRLRVAPRRCGCSRWCTLQATSLARDWFLL
jgi:hypothetical protein